MRNPLKGFDRIVCINLDRRVDRLIGFTERAKELSLYSEHEDWGPGDDPDPQFTRLRAIEGDRIGVPYSYRAGGPAYGCRMSHLRALEDALMDGLRTLIIFEDDCVFCKDFLERLDEFLKIIPNDWRGIMLGGQRMGNPPEEVVEGVMRSRDTTRTHAYILRGTDMMQAVHRTWTMCDTHIDHWNHRWQQEFPVYEPKVFLCGQVEGYSDIGGRDFTRRFWTNPKPIEGCPEIYIMDISLQQTSRIEKLGLHRGYSLDKRTGRDKGLIDLSREFYSVDGLEKWIQLIAAEAAEANKVPALWEPESQMPYILPALLTLKSENRIKLHHVNTADQGSMSDQSLVQMLPIQIELNFALREIIWVWFGGGREIIEFMIYNGFHVGFNRDPVSGLDNGVRQALAYKGTTKESHITNLLETVIRTLKHQCESMNSSRVLIAHPDLEHEMLEEIETRNPELKILTLAGSTRDGLIHFYEEDVEEIFNEIKKQRDLK